MNERLKELMIEAGYAAPELSGRANKLAELLIKECAGVCEDYSKQILKFSQFGSNAASDCAKMIKERFKNG